MGKLIVIIPCTSAYLLDQVIKFHVQLDIIFCEIIRKYLLNQKEPSVFIPLRVIGTDNNNCAVYYDTVKL